VCIARWIGFAATTVAGGTLTASLIPAERRGEGLGLYGVVAGVPALACLPAGVWMAHHCGYGPVLAVTAAAALLALASVPALPSRRDHGLRGGSALAGLRDPRLMQLALLFAASTVAAGVLVMFLPLAVTTATATAALFAPARSSHRGLVGRPAGSETVTARPGCCIPACCYRPRAWPSSRRRTCPPGNRRRSLLRHRLRPAAECDPGHDVRLRTLRGAYSTVSAIWNAAYDAGMGAGAAVIGLLATRASYPAAFLVTAALVLPALVPALRQRTPPTAPAAPTRPDPVWRPCRRRAGDRAHPRHR
jgi:hypothetical protein